MKNVFKRVGIITLNVVTFSTFGAVAYLAYLNSKLPNIIGFSYVELSQPLRVYDRDGELMASYGEERRIPLSYNALPSNLNKAILAVTDPDFENHGGVYLSGLFNSQSKMDGEGHIIVQGPSITQSLARQYFADIAAKSYKNNFGSELKSILLAYRIDRNLTKQEILTLNANKIYLGYKSYGFEAGAQTYFSKSLGDLNLSEIALLVAISRDPFTVNPVTNYGEAIKARNEVLKALRCNNYITEEQLAKAKEHMPVIRSAYQENNYNYATEIARAAMHKSFGEQAYRAGYEVYLTVEKSEQDLAQLQVRQNLLDIDATKAYRGVSQRLWTTNGAVPTQQEILARLWNVQAYAPIFPVVITSVTPAVIKVVNALGSEIGLTHNQLSWALGKGDSARTLSDVFRVGDVIYLGVSQNSPNFTRTLDLEYARHRYDPFNEDESYLYLAQVPEDNAAFVTLDSNNGALQTVVGGFDVNLGNANAVLESKYEVGGLIKPFIAAYALGKKNYDTNKPDFTLATYFEDKETPVLDPNDKNHVLWTVSNWGHKYHTNGVTLRTAIGENLNTTPIILADRLGVQSVSRYLERFNFNLQNSDIKLQLLTGTFKASALQIARAYATINNGGFLVNPYIVDRIDFNSETVYKANKPQVCEGKNCKNANIFDELIDGEGRVGELSVIHEAYNSSVYDFDIGAVTDKNYAPRIMNEDESYLIRSVLHTNTTGNSSFTGHAASVNQALKGLKRSDYGAMFALSDDHQTSWLAGYAGKFAGATLITSSSTAKIGNLYKASAVAAPMWNNFYSSTLNKYPHFNLSTPSNLVSTKINLQNGTYFAKGSDEWFIKGTEPIFQRSTPQPVYKEVVVTRTITKKVPVQTQPSTQKKNQYRRDGSFNDDEFNFYGD